MKKKLNCVLLIDDDEPTNYLSSLLIEQSGCAKDIKIKSCAKAALQYLQGCEAAGVQVTPPCPDLIFLDINMPAMNGWEFLSRYDLMEQAHKGKIILVMLTTSLNPEDKLRAENIEIISGFESKPLTQKKLENILEKYFPEYL